MRVVSEHQALVKTFLEINLAVYVKSLKNDHILPPRNSASRNLS